VVDYARGLTAVVPTGFPRVPRAQLGAFTEGIWLPGGEPVKAFDFPERNTLNYSGLDSNTPASHDTAKAIFPHLKQTPFVSLRACRNAADDLAEFVTCYHLTQKMGAPYKVTVHHDYPTVEVWFTNEPMRQPLVQQRFATIALFYQEAK
jgi:hypothetical protein